MKDKEKYGFVYIWYDKKHKRYYIGCHWGTIEDGYICSSRWMKISHKRRPEDFTRRILKRDIEDQKVLLDEEYKWLQLISDEHLGKKYFNLRNKHSGHWSTHENTRKSITQKISEKRKGKPCPGNKGKKRSAETKRKLSKYTKAHPVEYEMTDEIREKLSRSSKRLQREKRIGMHGRVHSEETIQKMKDNNAMKNPVYVSKISHKKQGIKWLTNGIDSKMAVVETKKYDDLIALGYYLGFGISVSDERKNNISKAKKGAVYMNNGKHNKIAQLGSNKHNNLLTMGYILGKLNV